MSDTYDNLDRPSAIPFVTPRHTNDPNPNATWGSTGDVAFGAAAMDVTVQPGGDVTTRVKAGPANNSGTSPAPPTP